MPQYILKFLDKGNSYYMMWDTVKDAPITYGASLDEFSRWYLRTYGAQIFETELPKKIELADRKGISSKMHNRMEDILSDNKAGDGGVELTKEQIVEKYIRARSNK